MLALLPAVSDAIRREADKISRENCSDCNAGDIYMVSMLRWEHDGSARPSDLIGPIYTTSAGVTGSLKRLEAAGFVERRTSPQDGRILFAVLTEAGNRAIESVSPAFDTLAQAVTAGLDDDDVTRLSELAEQYLESTHQD